MTNELFGDSLSVVNIGLESFGETLQQHGGKVSSVDWEPPADVDSSLQSALTELAKQSDEIQQANRTATSRLVECQPVWTDIVTAETALTLETDRTILHAGPPITWENMSGPLRGAVLGAITYEGWAETIEEAEQLAKSSEINFEPCHENGAVGPMAGVISPSMPLAKIINQDQGNVAFSNLNEGLGDVLRFGSYNESVIENIRWMEEILAPALRQAITDLDGIDLKHLRAKALHMGDEVHNRNVAGTALLTQLLAPNISTQAIGTDSEEILEFLGDNEHFFLNLSMAASKAATDAASGIEKSTIVTTMARNGTEFGIRVSGLGDQWFTAEAPSVDGLFFSDYTAADANRDIGDSSITETSGVGGFAMAASPAITNFVGGTPDDAVAYSKEMYEITTTENPNYTLPQLRFRGTPTGIDVLRVVDTGIHPIINTGIAHKEPGIGQIGAGVGRAPRESFISAIETFCQTYIE